MNWRPASNGAGPRHWFLFRDAEKVSDRYYRGANGQLVRYASHASAQAAAARLNRTVLVKCGSHRARRKLLALVGEADAEALFSMLRNTGHGGAYRIPARFEAEAKSITGVSGLRDGSDLHRCWKF